MSTLFCSNCKIDLQNDESLKEHYKSEFHRYNIKRSIVNLPAITLEQFQKKKTDVVDSRRLEKETPLKCDVCNKKFSSKATHKQHLESKKHQETVNNSPKKQEEIVVEKTEEVKKPKVKVTTFGDQSICLFCNEKSADINENLVHMRLQHSFFISDIKYLKDLNGLLKYLAAKIHKGCLCIYCENHQCKDFKSGEAVQQHMMDKGHCFMKTDDVDEYHKYYDFSKSIENMMYVGNADEPLQEGEEYYEVESGGSDDENGWESVDEEEEENEEDYEDEDEEEQEDGENEGEEIKEKKTKKSVKKDGDAEEKKPKRVHRYKIRKVKVLENGEIQLPNGKTLGHRKYRHLYKQFFRESMRETFVRHNFLGYSEERSLARIDRENRLIMMKQSIEARKKMKEHFENAHHVSRENHFYMKLGLMGNKNMPHFKNPNPL